MTLQDSNLSNGKVLLGSNSEALLATCINEST